MTYQKPDEVYYHLALISTPGIGHANAKFVLSHFPNIKDVFESPKSRLLKIPGIGEKAANALKNKSGFVKADAIAKSVDSSKMEMVSYLSPHYPAKLKRVLDAPYLFYYRGDLNALSHSRTVAIVGTRAATNYGKEMAKKIVTELSPYHAAIISGLAYGIDIEAHRESLNQGLRTIGVLAGGLDRIYPSLHQKTVEKMIESGGIISEQSPGTKPEAHLFPARNRIIAAMSDATVVVEAKKKGGALITAEIADSYNRPVFSVPGNLNMPTSEGCNFLIRNQKALLLTQAKDIAYYLNWSINEDDQEEIAVDLPELNKEEACVYQLLSDQKQGLTIDTIAWKSEIQVNKLASVLLSLEFKNLVKPLPGKMYKITY
ncbi:MAG: DNA processing protein [Cyclobacteriaceae bacterium]|jgi:DNA processing protein